MRTAHQQVAETTIPDEKASTQMSIVHYGLSNADFIRIFEKNIWNGLARRENPGM